MPPPRFASLNSVFKLGSDAAPTPPPKDPSLTPPSAGTFYNKSFFSRSSSSLIPDRIPARTTAPSPAPSFPSPSIEGSTDSSSSSGLYLLNAASSSSYTMGQPTPKKGVFKLASLARRNRSRKDLSDTVSATSDAKLEGDEGITLPWNFQHHIHVDEGYIGLPPSWSAALSQVGFGDDEIAAIHARRRAAATGLALDTRLADFPSSPHALVLTPQTSTSSPTLLDPTPRSTSLGKTRDPLASSILASTSSAPSPRAPSFSIKSFVSGIKSTLTSDSASTKEAVAGSSSATGEESEQYVLVDGDGPDEDDRIMGDETLIEPYPYDTSSVSSHHTSRSRQLSQGQETPRTPAFPQIQVQPALSDAGHVSLSSPSSSSSSAPRAPPLLAHSMSLPLPARSTSLPPSHSPAEPVSAPPRTPPRRIYHVANASEDFFDEPPPAYASPKREGLISLKEKQGSRVSVSVEQNMGGPSGTSNHDSSAEDQGPATASDISGTADDVLDISSYYSDDALHGGDAEAEPIQQARVLSPTPPLVIDKRLSKLATRPPRISFHQESSLEDWSESLFSVIGSKGKRSSILIGPNAAILKQERRTTIRPRSPPSVTGTETAEKCLTDISFGALGADVRGTIIAVDEEDEQEQAEEPKEAKDAVGATTAEESKQVNESPGAPLLPDVSPGPSLCKDPPVSTPSESPRRASIDSPPPSPPPKPKPKPTPLVLPPAITLVPPRTNVITGISGKSPVNSLFGVRPQPLPIPIPLSQIRAQLRPAPPKSPHPPPTLPLPPLKRIPSQPNLQPNLQSPPPFQLTPVPSPQKVFKHDRNASPASASDSRPDSSLALLPGRANSGDRDSDLSTITVTPATITTAKTEVVRTAVASVVDSDTVSLASKRESVVSTADAEPQTLAYDGSDTSGESPRTRERKEAPDDSTEPKTSSASLLRDGPQSKWPAPPPTPVEMDTDMTPRRVSRFRTTSLGRVHAMSGTAISPISSHSSHGSSDTMPGSTTESTPSTTPKGANGSFSGSPKPNGHFAPEAKFLHSTTGTFGGIDVENDTEEESEAFLHSPETPLRVSTLPEGHALLAQLQPYITQRNPASCFTNLVEIAEGESGSVFAARVAPSFAEQDGAEKPIPPNTSHVAIKRIPLPPTASLSDDSPASNKLASVLHELSVLKDLDHEHLLLLDAIYVCSAEDSDSANTLDTSLWIRMELMERSLADVIGLVAEGLALQERLIGRFASDILHSLDYLQRQHIAHRDVRSDNLLVNATGVVKLADFSNAVRVERNAPTVTGAVGVIYWQAPEMRAGPYNALKVDIWSLGATVWELAETIPPFSTPASPSTQMPFAIQTARRVGSQWPPLSHPQHYSRSFHEFLRLCGRESAGRPSPGELLNTPFIRNACGRPVILQLLSQCRSIEEAIAGKDAPVGQSP